MVNDDGYFTIIILFMIVNIWFTNGNNMVNKGFPSKWGSPEVGGLFHGKSKLNIGMMTGGSPISGNLHFTNWDRMAPGWQGLAAAMALAR